MKRDLRTGKFVSNWDSETKQRVSLTLTATAWRLLDEEAQRRGISRSEIIEQVARSLDECSDTGQPVAIEEINARKQAEDALKQANERFGLAAAAVNSAIYDWDIKQNHIKRTDNMGRLFGYSQTEIEPTSEWWLTKIHPDDMPQLTKALMVSLRESDRFSLEYRIRNKHNAYSYVAERGLIVRDEAGEAIRVVGSVYNISDRKQAEQELHIAQASLDLALEAAQMGTWDLDLINDTARRDLRHDHIFGYDSLQSTWGQAIAKHHVLPEDHEAFDESFRCALTETGKLHLEVRVKHQDGSIHWINALGQVYYDADRPVRMAGVVMDITERKQVEAALRQSEERYRYLAELIPQLVWIANAEGELLDVNQRWCNFTGLTLEQAKTQGWEAVVHIDDVPILGRYWAAAQQNATRYQAEGRMRRADGIYRWHLHQALPLKNEQGQIIKWFGTATDIEDQKQLEQKRDLILQQEQQAREAAENANRIKDEFLAVLSHELRSPLNPIIGWSRLLQTREFDQATFKNALATIERNAQLQVQLIEDLLDVSCILQGKLNLNVVPVNLVQVIEAAKETVRLAAEAKDIQIQTILAPAVGQVLGDSGRLQQVIWNLLTNAVKFTPAGGKVSIQLECIDTQGQITVTDTGKGISPEFLPHVFEYFRQADSTTTRQFGGLGLGLAIVRHLVELHGGTIWAESPGIDQGATFTVRLPLIKKELNHAEDINTAASNAATTSILVGIKILVVDDDPDACDFHTFVLKQSGAIVTAVTSAKAALQALAESEPDIILSDIGMPEIDGYMLMRQLKAMLKQQNKFIPAIALTAYAGEINQQQALSAGFQMHLSKPVEPEKLVRAIVTLIER